MKGCTKREIYSIHWDRESESGPSRIGFGHSSYYPSI